MRFANDFQSWLRHSWKLLANRLTRDSKIVIHGNSCTIQYIRLIYVEVITLPCLKFSLSLAITYYDSILYLTAIPLPSFYLTDQSAVFMQNFKLEVAD